MTRTQRMAPVQRVMEGAERESAQALATAQRRVAEAEGRHVQLQEFLREYQAGFARSAARTSAEGGTSSRPVPISSSSTAPAGSASSALRLAGVISCGLRGAQAWTPEGSARIEPRWDMSAKRKPPAP